MANKGNANIGYAFGGGAAPGLSHIGVLKVLNECGISPDIIAGTSIGALIDALYVGGLELGGIEQFVLGFEDIIRDIERAEVQELHRLALVPEHSGDGSVTHAIT